MTLPAEEIARQTTHFRTRTAEYASLGYDRFAAAAFVLDEAGPLDGPVLDVGTGMGITARAIAGRGLDVVSIDTNEEDLAVAVALTEQPAERSRIQFLPASAASLPFPNGHFGAAVAVDVLHHLDAGLPALAELARVVRRGGAVVLADFSRDGFDLVRRVHASEGRVHHEGPVTLDWARGVLCGGVGLVEDKRSVGHLHDVSVLRVPEAGGMPLSFAMLDRLGLRREARSAGAPAAVDGARLHPHCVVCGDGQAHGLGLSFRSSPDGSVEATFDCRESVEGYAGMVHGGVVSMVLDGAMVHCLFHRGLVAHTGELTVRFRQPVLVRREACLRAWLERSRGRMHVLRAELSQDGRVKAVATAKFVEPVEPGEAAEARRTR